MTAAFHANDIVRFTEPVSIATREHGKPVIFRIPEGRIGRIVKLTGLFHQDAKVVVPGRIVRVPVRHLSIR